MRPLVGVTGQPSAYARNDPVNNTDPTVVFCVGSLCTPKSVGDVLGSRWDATGGRAVSYVDDHKIGILKGTSYALAGGAIAASFFTGGTSLAALPTVLAFGAGGYCGRCRGARYQAEASAAGPPGCWPFHARRWGRCRPLSGRLAGPGSLGSPMPGGSVSISGWVGTRP